MFGVPHIKVDVVNGFNLQEIRFFGHGTRRSLGFGYIRSHSASFSWSCCRLFYKLQKISSKVRLCFNFAEEITRHYVKFYDKGGLIANEKRLMLSAPSLAKHPLRSTPEGREGGRRELSINPAP
jgi:hypothetical protein